MAVFRETKNGRNSISSAAQPNSLFMTLSSGEILTVGSNASAGQTRCQRAIYAMLTRARDARVEIESLYRFLAQIAAQASALRDVDSVDLASQIIVALPVSAQRKNIAVCDQGFCLNRKGAFEAAREIADQLLEQSLSPRLRSRSLLIKAASYFYSGAIDQSLEFYVEAGRIARECDSTALVNSLRMAAIIKSMHGDHDKAAADLESLVPLACQISSHDAEAYAATLNSYAVQLGEIGHVEQALNVVSRVAAFSSLVPQITDTIAELQSKLPTRKHSVVVIHRPTEPIAAPQAEPNPVRKPTKASTFVIREAERRFTSLRAPPASRLRFTTYNLAASNPARQPTKPRAP